MTESVLIVDDEQLLIVENEILEILDAAEETIILDVAEQGVPGPQGPPGQAGVSFLTFAADGALSGHRMVRVTEPGKVGYADSNTAEHAHTVIGMTRNAALDGDSVEVQTSGELSEPSWNWIVNQPVFLGIGGVATQIAPTTGFVLIVGLATRPTSIVLGIKQPLMLEN